MKQSQSKTVNMLGAAALKSCPTDLEAAWVNRLVDEMASSWRMGNKLTADELFTREPGILDRPETAVRLIYEEFCLHQEHGQPVSLEAILQRFPQWKDELVIVLDCHRLMHCPEREAWFPAVGEYLGEYHLLAELGRGALGRVFLAKQASLGDRAVVLKLTPCDGEEHLSLARLQNTHIVPLYAVHDFPEYNLRALCMPSLGGVTLERLLERLPHPLARARGKDWLAVLDEAQQQAPVSFSTKGPIRSFLARASHVEAVCWMGACLADALHYAHERDVVHLDLKPSNILLAADGQPMLLDFHLAQEPIRPDGPPPLWLGGTPEHMSPEQEEVLASLRANQPIRRVVDGRSDIYSLGLVLHEALGGTPGASEALWQTNRQVSRGLSDIVAKCLAPAPEQRYATGRALAEDLRRHLADQPLQGVANRSLGERWRKWRRRQPYALPLASLMLALLGALLAAGLVIATHHRERQREAAVALSEGQMLLQQQQYREAVQCLSRGLQAAEQVPGQADLVRGLNGALNLAQRGRNALDLHDFVEGLRFACMIEAMPGRSRQGLEMVGREVWGRRDDLRPQADVQLENELELRMQQDWLDLAILWSDLHVRFANPEQAAAARADALGMLTEAEELYGPNPLLTFEKARHDHGKTPTAAGRSVWEHCGLGRSLLWQGDLERAERCFQQALALQPRHFWSTLYAGVCAQRREHYQDAVIFFSTCIGQLPRAECFYHRALAYTAWGQAKLRGSEGAAREFEHALADFEQAQRLNQVIPAIPLRRGMLLGRLGRHEQALQDLARALELGADPATVHYQRALVFLARDDRAAAATSVQEALRHHPQHADALELGKRLQRRSP